MSIAVGTPQCSACRGRGADEADRMRIVHHHQRVVRSARSQMAARFAIVPSIENTPSVAISRVRAPARLS
jgi:hypothetical protein